MALILNLIPAQNFEVVRDQIGAILLLELTAQLSYAADPEDIIILTAVIETIFAERTSPFEHDELMMINIQTSEGSYSNESIDSSDGEYEYLIDVFSTAKTKEAGERGDVRSKKRLLRLIGFIRAILKNSNYIRLGNDTAPPIISGTTVARFQIQEPQNNQDAASANMGRLTFSVRANEKTQQIQPSVLNEYHTQVKLFDTELGLRYENVPTA